MWTPLVEKQIPDQSRTRGISEEDVVQKILLAGQPTKRFVDVDEVAALAAFLVSDAAKSITGAMLSIDGGWTAQKLWGRRFAGPRPAPRPGFAQLAWMTRRRRVRPKRTGPHGPRFRASTETTGQAEKLDPQPQVVVAFGFLMTNCAPSRPSL